MSLVTRARQSADIDHPNLRKEAAVKRREKNTVFNEGKQQRRERYDLHRKEALRLRKRQRSKAMERVTKRIGERRAHRARTEKQLLARMRRWGNYLTRCARRGKVVTRKRAYPEMAVCA